MAQAKGPLLPHVEHGAGRPLVLFQGFGTRPESYESTARLVGRRCRVVVPAMFALEGRWRPERALGELERLLEALGIDRASFVAHSFGGGLLLELFARRRDLVADLVFCDTLAMAREWRLAEEAAGHPLRLVWMATPRAARDFVLVAAMHPLQLLQAAWWGFVSDRRAVTDEVRRATIDCHVLWASRDSILKRSDGLAFALDLGASFSVVESPLGDPVDHDWLFRHPWLAEERLGELKLWALGEG